MLCCDIDGPRPEYYSVGVPAEEVEIIPNGIDITDCSSLPALGSFRNKFGLGLNEPSVVLGKDT